MNQKEVFWLSLTIFVTMIAWMILDLYKVNSQTTIDSDLKSMQVVDFSFDPRVLEKIKSRTP